MICVSIGELGFNDCRKALSKVERLHRQHHDVMAEIRLDLCGLNEKDTSLLFEGAKLPLLATCRPRTIDLCMPAVLAGAEYVDIDVLQYPRLSKELLHALEMKGVKLILSFHDYNGTPSDRELEKIYRMTASYHPWAAKIVTTATCQEDARRVLSLYRFAGESQMKLIAFAMGKEVTWSRYESLIAGAPHTYCSLAGHISVVHGMPSLSNLEDFLKKSRYRVEGDVEIPCSKSVTQRAIVAAALAKGSSELRNFSHCRDIDAAVGVAKALSARVFTEGGTLNVESQGYPFEKKAVEPLPFPNMIIDRSLNMTLGEAKDLFVGESGLLSRLCIPIAAQLGMPTTVSGEGSLLERHMYGCREALEDNGASCILTENETLPAVVSGPLKGGNIEVSGRKGSQLISGLLMALPLSRKDSKLTVTEPTSVPYIMLTLKTLEQSGIRVEMEVKGKDLIFTIPGRQRYLPLSADLEGDWSSASYFIAAAALFGSLSIGALNPDSLQADRRIVSIMQEAGARIYWSEGRLMVERSHLVPFNVDVADCPDLFPTLVALALYIDGDSVIQGIQRLRNKESDRVSAVREEFGKMGMQSQIAGDRMIISGKSLTKRLMDGDLLHGGKFKSHADHRIVMALKIASIGISDKMSFESMDCVDKSFPSFKELFKLIQK